MPSPLKNKPDRLPGQSLDEHLSELFDNKLLPPIVGSVLAIEFCILEWIKYIFAIPPNPISTTILAVAVIIFSFFYIRKNLKQIQILKQGRDGERAVGLYLERLGKLGYSVLHDIQGDHFNIDHVLVCTKGIFTIETKTWSKADAKDNITFDNRGVGINGHFGNDRVIKQALAQAKWLKDIVRETNGHTYVVRPVIVFPDWFVQAEGTKKAKREGVWLLNPKALSVFIKNEPDILTPEEVSSVISSLRNYNRSKDF